MTWGKLLQPDWVVGDSILAIAPERLHQQGLKGLILDVDETLVPVTTSVLSHEVRDWVDRLRPSAKLWLASNNTSESRIGRIARALDVPYFAAAAKPSRRKLRRALEAMDLPPEAVGMVGDRLFTDVLAGNRLGMFTILVQPMVDPAWAARYHPLRTLEVTVSKAFGATFPSKF